LSVRKSNWVNGSIGIVMRMGTEAASFFKMF